MSQISVKQYMKFLEELKPVYVALLSSSILQQLSPDVYRILSKVEGMRHSDKHLSVSVFPPTHHFQFNLTNYQF